MLALLGGQADVELGFLDVSKVHQDSTDRAAFALLEFERFGHLLARDLAHFLEHASERPAFEF